MTLIGVTPLKTFNVLSSNIYLPGFALGNDSHNEYVFDMHKKNITFSNTDLTTRFLFIFNAVRKEVLSNETDLFQHKYTQKIFCFVVNVISF